MQPCMCHIFSLILTFNTICDILAFCGGNFFGPLNIERYIIVFKYLEIFQACFLLLTPIYLNPTVVWKKHRLIPLKCVEMDFMLQNTFKVHIKIHSAMEGCCLSMRQLREFFKASCLHFLCLLMLVSMITEKDMLSFPTLIIDIFSYFWLIYFVYFQAVLLSSDKLRIKLSSQGIKFLLIKCTSLMSRWDEQC